LNVCDESIVRKGPLEKWGRGGGAKKIMPAKCRENFMQTETGKQLLLGRTERKKFRQKARYATHPHPPGSTKTFDILLGSTSTNPCQPSREMR